MLSLCSLVLMFMYKRPPWPYISYEKGHDQSNENIRGHLGDVYTREMVSAVKTTESDFKEIWYAWRTGQTHGCWHSTLPSVRYWRWGNWQIHYEPTHTDWWRSSWSMRLKRMTWHNYALPNWYTYIFTSSMYTMYRLFKKQLNFEDYWLSCNYRERASLTKYRCANSKIPVYNQLYMYETELCTFCDLNVNGDEYHYIMICPYFRQSRELYLKHYFYTR